MNNHMANPPGSWGERLQRTKDLYMGFREFMALYYDLRNRGPKINVMGLALLCSFFLYQLAQINPGVRYFFTYELSALVFFESLVGMFIYEALFAFKEIDGDVLLSNSFVDTFGIIYLGYQVSVVIREIIYIYKQQAVYVIKKRNAVKVESQIRTVNALDNTEDVLDAFKSLKLKDYFLSKMHNLFTIVPIMETKKENIVMVNILMTVILTIFRLRILVLGPYVVFTLLFSDQMVMVISIAALVS